MGSDWIMAAEHEDGSRSIDAVPDLSRDLNGGGAHVAIETTIGSATLRESERERRLVAASARSDRLTNAAKEL